MPMELFAASFPDLYPQEMRCVAAYHHDILPDGQYGFSEYYCNEPGCDCRRVVIRVVTPTSPNVLATINYGWESAEFYRKWMRNPELADAASGGPHLDPLGKQTPLAPALLDIFREILQDEAYVARLKRHYALFKSTVQKAPAEAQTTLRLRGIGRTRRAALQRAAP